MRVRFLPMVVAFLVGSTIGTRIHAQTLPAIALEAVVPAGLDNPLYLTHAGDSSGRLFVGEQCARIRIIQGGTLRAIPFLDLTSQAGCGGAAADQGLLGLAFHPDYHSNGRFFVYYFRAGDGVTVLSEYRVSGDPNIAGTTERMLLVTTSSIHNGGMLEFGPEGFLYVGTGHGGVCRVFCLPGQVEDQNDPAQDLADLRGKILRIDVDRGTPYAIPPDNPLATGGGRPEVFAYGLRQPYRFSFDRVTGLLFAGDVGQEHWEELNIVVRGGNYGWGVMEGAHCLNQPLAPPTICAITDFVLPVLEYPNELGFRRQGLPVDEPLDRPLRCSITSGYVYRGSRIPSLVGTYVFGDFCSGEIFALVEGRQQTLLRTGLLISSFGEDQTQELYVVGYGSGTLHRIVPGPPPPPSISQPTITAPTGGSQLRRGAPVTLTWTAVAGAGRYGIEFTGRNRRFAKANGTEPDAVNGFGGAGGGVVVDATSVTIVVPTSLTPGTYQVRVIGLPATGDVIGTFSDALTLLVLE